jgi:nicotinate-nucleotide--dimethylbenzimidazole phosphoribosyltransferase
VSGADLRVVDVGVASDLPAVPGVISRKVAHGTNNFCCEAAMSRAQAEAALWAGMEMAQQASLEGCALIGIGEMGIGNTTAASAMTAVLTGMPVASVVGRGTGADDACLIRKISAVERALALHEPGIRDAFDILERLGGFEIGAMAGACLGAAAHGRVVVVDGFIATVAAAWAVRLRPEVADYLFVSHRSTEPGHALLLDAIRQRPLLDLEMRLGEGTGAALAIPMIRAAVEAFTCMATFADAGVSDGAEAR